jgi:hypothetical protein
VRVSPTVLHAALAKLHLPPEKIEELIPIMKRARDNPEGCPIDDHLPPSEYLRGALHGMLHYLAAEHSERCAALAAPEAALPSPRSPHSEEDFLGSPVSLVSPPSPPGVLLLSRSASEDAVGQPAAAAALTTPPKRRPSKVRRFLQKMLTPGSSAAAAAAAAAVVNGGAPAATAGAAAAAAVNSAKSSPGRDAPPTAGAYACSAGSDAGENGELGLSELGDNSGAWREALTPALEDEESSALAAVAVAAADGATGSNRKSLRAAGRSSFAKLWGRDDVAGDVVTGASGHNSLVSTTVLRSADCYYDKVALCSVHAS